VINPNELPANVIPASDMPSSVKIPIDPENWDIITDAMSNVPTPLGTAGSAHLQGIDFAGKTGSAQTVSNALKAKTANGKSKYKDNAWFVGVTPRRNPEIVVAVLFEGGEHGQFAARIAAQVVKAYVEKQRHQPTKVASENKKVEIGAVWNSASPDGTDQDTLHGGRFVVDVSKKRAPLAVAAPGVQ
jgi:penicillin-binding protein 2